MAPDTPSAPLEHGHTPDEIRARLAEPFRASYIRDFVYGGIDGAITTFAIVAGSQGANLGARTALILGLANLLADGLSMAAGDYAATKSEGDQYKQLAAVEGKHTDVVPTGEREEVRQILAQKGFTGEALTAALITITSNRDRWISFMLTEEYGVAPTVRRPPLAAAATFAAFLLCGAVPLLPFIAALPHAFETAILVTMAVFFAIGAWKSRWSPSRWWMSGLETIFIGGGAAAVAFGVGYVLRTLL